MYKVTRRSAHVGAEVVVSLDRCYRYHRYHCFIALLLHSPLRGGVEMHVPRFFSLVLSVLTLSPTAVRADDATFTPAASTFWLEQENIVFSINIANDSSDVYFHLSGPASSWVGIGFGSKMEDSLMVIAYPDDSGSSMAPRYSLPLHTTRSTLSLTLLQMSRSRPALAATQANRSIPPASPLTSSPAAKSKMTP